MRFSSVAFVLISVLLGGCAAGEDQPLKPRRPIALNMVPVQFDDRRVECFAVSAEQWHEIASLFTPPSPDAESERQAIRMAVARFEQLAGEQLPTGNDARKNRGHGSGQTDCTDESTNTTTYLRLLQQHGLLHHHRVMNKAFRGVFELDTHWTAQVQDTGTGMIYVVDSWYLANGMPPFVQPTSDWKRKKPFPESQVAELPESDRLIGLPGM